MEDGPLPDLRDIELKLGRKVPGEPSALAPWEEPVPPERDRDPRVGGAGGGSGCSSSSSCCSFLSLVVLLFILPNLWLPSRPSHSSSTLERLETKLHLLRQEMVSVVRRLWDGTRAARPGRWSRGERATGAAEQRAECVGNTGESGRAAGAHMDVAAGSLFTGDLLSRSSLRPESLPCSVYFLKPTRCYRL